MHVRSAVAAHRFIYPIAFLRLPLSKLKDGRNWAGLFGVNRGGLFSFHNRDHGQRDGSPLLPWLLKQLDESGAHFALGEVVLQCFPRVFGYVFNPVSFWFCHDQEGQLRAVLCEVNNTFGEAHNYLLHHSGWAPIKSGDQLNTQKVFHVSPFFPVSGSYHFNFLAQARVNGAHIEYRESGVTALRAHVGGRARPLNALALLSSLLRFPFMTMAVMVRIHWHAVQLWAKGARFHRKPEPPLERTT